MRLDNERESLNVEDRRGGGLGGGFGGRGVAVGGGLGTLVIVLIAMFLGVDPGAILGGGAPAPGYEETAPRRAPADTA
ncbi:MAG: neutral zinc metallopeptidase, partial [Acetobacteraceae bacterium]|nr:neutral zinc metallopeptidase [Acetobacteraceae bacterium]